MSQRNEYLDAMESLLGHPGWKYITEDAQRQIYQLQADALDIKVCKNWDEVNVARGKAQTLAEILMMATMIQHLRKAHDASV
jgi:hypothetical protein